MIADKINGTYELIGGLFVFLHCWKLFKDKSVKGVSVKSFVFFASWGVWNLYYYPHLGQMWSFIGGCHIVFWNIVWICLAVYYKKKQ